MLPSDSPADPHHVLVDINTRILEFATVSHNDILCFVCCEERDDITQCRLVLPIPSYKVRVFAGFLGYSSNMDDISAGMLFQLIA